MKAILWEDDSLGAQFQETTIPEDLREDLVSTDVPPADDAVLTDLQGDDSPAADVAPADGPTTLDVAAVDAPDRKSVV